MADCDPAQVPAVVSLVMLASLLVMPDPKLAYAIPLLVPFALLAALEVDSLKRGFSGALDWFGILTFGLVALVAWGIWIDSYVNGMSPRIAQLFRDSESGFQPSFHLGTILSAIALTLLWITLVRPARRSNRRAILNGRRRHASVGLATTIWLPYRLAAQLSVGRRERVDAHAAQRLRREPRLERTGARCSTISRTFRPCARKSSRTTTANSCSSSTAGRRRSRHRPWAGGRCGTAIAAATTPSGTSLCTEV